MAISAVDCFGKKNVDNNVCDMRVIQSEVFIYKQDTRL